MKVPAVPMFLSLVLVAATSGWAETKTDAPGWWLGQPLRIIQTNMREIDADLDPAKLAREVKAMDANAVIFSVAGIRAFYQTELKYHRKAAALRGDLAPEAAAAFHKEGLRFIARLDMSKADKSFFKDNPDWFTCDARGRPHEYNGLYICCPNGAYYRDYSHRIITEVIERVKPDALFFNMFGFTSRDYAGVEIPLCHCAGCRKRYQDFAGKPLPDDMGPGHPDHAKYQEFQRRCVDEVAREYRALIARVSNGRAALFTYHPEADIVRMEANSNVRSEPRTNIFYVAQNVGAFKMMRPEKPCSCTIVHFLDIPYRYASEPAALTALRLVQSLAVGGELDFYVLGTLEQPDRRDFADVKKWFGHYAKNATMYFQSRSVARTALVRRGGDAFKGAYRLLIDRGAPFDLVELRPDLAARDFHARYGLIWYPGMLREGSEDARLLEQYVREGGTLVATCDADAPPPGFFGVTRQSYDKDARTAYWRLTPRDAFPHEPRAELIYAMGSLMECQPAAGTESFLSLIPPHSCAPPELAYWTKETKTPGLFIHAHGKGRVVFFPWSLDSLYGRFASPSHRELALDVLDNLKLAPEPARVRGGRNVMVAARRSADGTTTLIHLINLTGYDGTDIREPEPLSDIEVQVPPGEDGAKLEGRLLVGGHAVLAQHGVFRIPKIELFETLAISNSTR